ncbi:holo-ACP synthase [Reinekea marinisedimentorum]|uniref:Holo-[acyl-carrier-protein] synthase n=1 Tax=Reinekea marinisedimentorum TaxID=230495 RepID=A0A4R3I2L0_9GAMM|nr:holo-ACP synthase [Reinekea marinisedimentorum]TCS39812.1 holo-[acyl-carrier protein] synthase [Reinekea marinisedimentorum]
MKGIGTDIVQVSRIRSSLEKQGERFVSRILTEAEQVVYAQRNKPANFVANRFAAKEAISKALGTGIAAGIRFTDIEVLPNERGAPRVALYGEAAARLTELQATDIHLSISDEKDYAVAFVVLI